MGQDFLLLDLTDSEVCDVIIWRPRQTLSNYKPFTWSRSTSSRPGTLTAPIRVGRLAPLQQPRDPRIFKNALSANNAMARKTNWRPADKSDDAYMNGENRLALSEPRRAATLCACDTKDKVLNYTDRGCCYRPVRKVHHPDQHLTPGPKTTSRRR